MEISDETSSTLDDVDGNKLTGDELIRSELKGKFYAVERYDAILWKIRSGYTIVLYGALAIIGGSQLNMSAILGNDRFFTATLILIWGFSLCGFAIDVGFTLSKLRVVTASNELYTLALKVALGKSNLDQEYTRLQDLLQNSGESLQEVPSYLLWNTLRWLIPLYFGTPMVGTIIYALSFF